MSASCGVNISSISKNKDNKYQNQFLPSKIAIIEIIVILGSFCGIQYFITGSINFMDVSPHPLWIPILLLSVQYGTLEGLYAVMAVVTLMWLPGIPEQAPAEDFNTYLLRIGAEPVMWGLTATILGFFRDRHKGELDALQHELCEAQEQRDTISATCEKLRRSNRTLQRHIAKQPGSFSAVYEAIHKVRSTNVKDIAEPLTTCMDTLAGAEKFSVFVMNERGLQVVLEKGWEPTDKWRSHFHKEDLLYQAMLIEKKILVNNHLSDTPLLQAQGITALPLLSPANNGVIGMLKVEEISQKEFIPERGRNLKFLAEQVAQSIAYSSEGIDYVSSEDVETHTNRFKFSWSEDNLDRILESYHQKKEKLAEEIL